MRPIALSVVADGATVGAVEARYHSAACRVCGEAIYDTSAFQNALVWLHIHLRTLHNVEGSMVDLAPLE